METEAHPTKPTQRIQLTGGRGGGGLFCKDVCRLKTQSVYINMKSWHVCCVQVERMVSVDEVCAEVCVCVGGGVTYYTLYVQERSI